MLISSLFSRKKYAPTWVGTIEQVGNFCDIFESFLVYMTLFAQFVGIFACQFEWRVTAQCTAPVIQKNREGKLPLLYLTVHHIVHLILK
jgi:hypothetical protein